MLALSPSSGMAEEAPLRQKKPAEHSPVGAVSPCVEQYIPEEQGVH